MAFANPFDAMQEAVNIVGQSEHPHNKIAASLFFEDGRGLSRTNYWPEPVMAAFGPETSIGNSSGTVHAETACILHAPFATGGASLAITDPFCPNCAKNIAGAGIKAIYIDHKGFDKDFFQRRGGHFDTMSMRICEKAGIAVYELWRKDRRLSSIFEPPQNYAPIDDSPAQCEPIEKPDEAVFKQLIAAAFARHDQRKFAVAIAGDQNGAFYSIIMRSHAVTGFTMNDPQDIAAAELKEEKYSLFQEPVNRLLMFMARKGLKPVDGYIFSAHVPTSREQVNLAGAGIKRITIGDIKKARDAASFTAMQQLSQAGIIEYH
ncbi:MAG: deoxycytidylate deaminase [Micavibrio sp.]